MEGDKEDDGLELSLTLKCPGNSSNLSPPALQQPAHWQLLFQPIDRNVYLRRGAAIPVVDLAEDEIDVSSPNDSTVSSLSGKRSDREANNVNLNGDENEAERASSSGKMSDEEDGGRKKLRLTREQSAVLEDMFRDHNTLNQKQKVALAKQLDLRPRQVEVWFQNRRARTKLKQTEVDCEYLKRCCENLTEENRRLHKEVQELRALKLSPQMYMQMTPATTLTICPSCERVSSSAAAGGGNGHVAGASGSGVNNSVGLQVQPPVQMNIPWATLPVHHAGGQP
uniref:Homeobox domain-containing protein n=1 Tax=Kalanchoe fedtschenkoi TaxID=63787 RepID=A0A7N0UIR1_KALFE